MTGFEAHQIRTDLNIVADDFVKKLAFGAGVLWGAATPRPAEFKTSMDPSSALWSTVPEESFNKDGETLLFVPRSQIVTMDMALNTPIGKLMKETNL